MQKSAKHYLQNVQTFKNSSIIERFASFSHNFIYILQNIIQILQVSILRKLKWKVKRGACRTCIFASNARMFRAILEKFYSS